MKSSDGPRSGNYDENVLAFMMMHPSKRRSSSTERSQDSGGFREPTCAIGSLYFCVVAMHDVLCASVAIKGE